MAGASEDDVVEEISEGDCEFREETPEGANAMNKVSTWT